VECSNAADVLDRAHDCDCVVLDYLLPGATALDLLPELRRLLPEAPVIVLTGYGDEQIAVELMKAGASDYLSKERLDGRLLARAVIQALVLGEARARFERAERAQDTYLVKLRQLVELTTELFGVPTIEERLKRAAAAARALLGAREAFAGVRLPQGAVRFHALEDGEVVPLSGAHPRFAAEWEEALATPPARRLETKHADGDEMLFSYRLWPRDGSVMGVICAIGRVPPPELADALSSLFAQLGEMVTAAVENARLYEATQRAVSARDAMIAVVSHDLRSPLSSLSLGLELLQEGGSAEETRVVIDRMGRSARLMKRLIDDLLDVARIENGELSVKIKPERAGALVDDARALAAPLAESAGVTLRVAGAPDVEVQADRQRVVQVLTNLLGNALKFTPSGGTVSLECEVRPDEVRFSVTDSGPGIAPTHLPHVFERFWRKDGRGLGLGLFIARAIVLAHGGRIWVESQPGKGARFTFTLAR
jgi:signal transduction histidine kinase